MKTRYFSAMLIAGFVLLGLASCSNEDQPTQVEEQTAQVSFSMVMPEGVLSKAVDSNLGDTPWKSYTQCMTQFDDKGQPIPSNPNFPLVANMEMVRTSSGVGPSPLIVKVNIVKRSDGSYVTDPVTVDADKEYTIQNITITDAANLSQVYFSGVQNTALFAPYVSQTLPQTFTVPAFTKPIIDVWVLCARGFEPEKFGKPKFDINRVEVSCIPIFVDVCDRVGEDFVAEGVISLQKINKTTSPVAADFANAGKVTDNLASGSISYLCFADDLDQADANEWFLISITYKNPDTGINTTVSEIVSLDKMKAYKSLKAWNDTYDFLDVLICGDFCIFNCNTQENPE